MINWITENLATPFFVAVGAVGMKLIDWWLTRKKSKKDLTAQDIKNTSGSIDNFNRLNTLLGKQLEVNVQRYLDILNTNISLKGDNAALREQIQELRCEVKKLKSDVKDFELEVSKLKEYIKKNK